MQRKIKIGKWVLCLALFFSLVSFSGFECLQAQDFPSKPINIVLPFGSGGLGDLILRMISPLAPKYFGQPFVLHVRPGGGGAIGSNEVAQAAPDGYTLLSGGANAQSILVAVTGRSKGPDDLTAVCRFSQVSSAYWVRADAPWKTFQEMIAWAKGNPGKLIYGNTGTWSATDFAWRLLEKKARFTSQNVPFTTGAEPLVALLGNHIHVTRLGTPQTLPHYRAGKLRALAVWGSSRSKVLPGVPSLTEAGYDLGGVGGNWLGFFVPKETPKPIIARLAEGFKKITEDKQAIAGIEKLGGEYIYMGPDEFSKAWREEYLSYKELAKIFKK
jgi:tripartite-type tricarboxylate transporter receptor subunit TctC